MVRTIDAHEALVLDVAFSTHGGRLATASFDGTAKVWDVDSGLNLRTFRGHTGSACGVAFSPDGRLIASCGFDKTVRLWDADLGGDNILTPARP